MSEGWPTKAISDVCDVRNGGTPKTKVSEYWDGTHAWITPAEMGKRSSYFVDSTARYITDSGLKNSSAKLVPPYSVILSSRAPIGHVVINEVPMAFNQGCRGLVPSDKLDHLFLAYFLTANVEQLNNLGTGATFKELSSTKLKAVAIPVPPKAEQKRIVSILDEAFGAIAKAKRIAEKNLSNAIELFDSYLNRVFTEKGEGWEETTLGDSCEFFNGKAHEKCIDEEGDYVVVNSKFISQEGRVRKHTSSQLFPLFEDDLVMVMSDVPKGKALAKCYLIEKDDTYTLNQRICAIRTERFHKRFLLHHLNRHPYLLAFDNKGSQANLRKIDILSCPLYMPSDEDQREIAAEIDAIHNDTRQVEAIYAKKNDCLDELKQSILQKAFTGQLTAKSPELEAVP